MNSYYDEDYYDIDYGYHGEEYGRGGEEDIFVPLSTLQAAVDRASGQRNLFPRPYMKLAFTTSEDRQGRIRASTVAHPFDGSYISLHLSKEEAVEQWRGKRGDRFQDDWGGSRRHFEDWYHVHKRYNYIREMACADQLYSGNGNR